jgi:hypothetical protein
MGADPHARREAVIAPVIAQRALDEAGALKSGRELEFASVRIDEVAVYPGEKLTGLRRLVWNNDLGPHPYAPTKVSGAARILPRALRVRSESRQLATSSASRRAERSAAPKTTRFCVAT